MLEQTPPDGLMEQLITTELLVTEQLTQTQNNQGYNLMSEDDGLLRWPGRTSKRV